MLEINKIYCGDNLDLLRKLKDNSIDIIITSPPYNYNMEYDTYKDNVEWDYYINWLNEIWKECYRVLVRGGRLCINIQPNFKLGFPTHHIIGNHIINLKFLWKTEIIWDKGIPNCPMTAWGSYMMPSCPYLRYSWEFIEVYCKEDYKKEGKRENSDLTAEEFKLLTDARWKIPTEKNMKKYNHPAMFPEEVVYRLLKLFSFVGDIVLDIFNGVGTTTLVAKKIKRNFIGFELSKIYCDRANKRLEELKFNLF